MLGINYFKAEPTEFVRIRVGDKVKREGIGISMFYMPFKTTIEMTPITANDQPFVFQEMSQDNQEVTLQGGFIYRFSDPITAMKNYNFSINPRTKKYQNEDNTKLSEHILHLVRGKARKIVQKTSLEKLLVMGDNLANKITESLAKDEMVTKMGIDFQTLYFGAITPKPDIAKALEATYREELLQKADEAIYARRAQAVEKERIIKENEMRTQIEIEQKRKELVELEGANNLQGAIYKSKAIKEEITAYNETKPEMIVAQALLKMGENAERISNLTITPEILAGII